MMRWVERWNAMEKGDTVETLLDYSSTSPSGTAPKISREREARRCRYASGRNESLSPTEDLDEDSHAKEISSLLPAAAYRHRS